MRTMNARGSMALAMVLTLTTNPPCALAQAEPTAPSEAESEAGPEPEPSEPASDQTRADALIDEGVELRTEGREREALARFQQAYALAPSPRALAQMGLAEKSLRSYLKAESHLDEALAGDGDPWILKHRAALEAARAFVAKQLAWLQVTTNVPGAELRVNGSVVGALPLTEPRRVVAGRVVLEVRAEGYMTNRREIALAAEETTELDLSLSQLEPMPDDPPEPSIPNPPPDTGPEEEPPSWTPWIVSTGALGLVGLAVGTGLGIRALQIKSELDEICPDVECDTTEGIELDDEGRAMAAGSTVAFTIGGLAVATSVVLWILEPEAPNVASLVVPRGNGVAIRF